MDGRFVIVASIEPRIAIVGKAFDPIEQLFKPCHHTTLEHLRLDKWHLWVCAHCWIVRDLEQMEDAA
jgi:hypothetical protein